MVGLYFLTSNTIFLKASERIPPKTLLILISCVGPPLKNLKYDTMMSSNEDDGKSISIELKFKWFRLYFQVLFE